MSLSFFLGCSGEWDRPDAAAKSASVSVVSTEPSSREARHLGLTSPNRTAYRVVALVAVAFAELLALGGKFRPPRLLTTFR